MRALAALMAVAAVAPASASAVTIGSLASTEPPSVCSGISEPVFLAQLASASGSYTVPAGGGFVTSWSTSFGSPGAALSLIVLKTTSNPALLTVVGSDSEILPTPIPADHVSTFTPAAPIPTEAGDIIGLQLPAASGAACIFEGGASDKFVDGHAGALTPGSTLTAVSESEKALINVSATITQSVDLGLSEAITPSSAPPGVALITLTASNAGPAAVPATVTDVVPSGLKVLGAAVAGGGSCSVAGQAVSCELSSVALAGTPPAVDIVVASSTPGVYSNQALIAAALTDSNPANNATSATLTVTAPVSPPAPAPAQCKVIALKGAPLAIAKTVLSALNCSIGKVSHAASKTVAKGLVIGTTPKAGTSAAAQTKVGITLSSGKPKPAKRKPAKRH